MDSNLLNMVLQSLLGLGFVLGLFALLIWAMRRMQQHTGKRATRDFKIIQRMHIDSKNSIVEIRHEGEHYLLGLSPGGMVQLHSRAGTSAPYPAEHSTTALSDHVQ